MQVTRTVCNECGKEAKDEKAKRHEEWIELCGRLQVWLERSRQKKVQSFMHTIGWKDGHADFCSIACLLKALKKSVIDY